MPDNLKTSSDTIPDVKKDWVDNLNWDKSKVWEDNSNWDKDKNLNENTIPYARFKEINDKLKFFEDKVKLEEEEKLKKEWNFAELLKTKETEYNQKLEEYKKQIDDIEKDKLFLKYNLDKSEYIELVQDFGLEKTDKFLETISNKLKSWNITKLDNNNANWTSNANWKIFTREDITKMTQEDFNKNKELINEQYAKWLIK